MFIDLLVILLYVLLTLLMSYPMCVRLGIQAAGQGNDMWVSHWNNWWLHKALVEGRNPYHTSYLFYPQGVSLVWHSFSWFNTGLWLLLRPLIGPLAAHSVAILLSYVLSGYTTYLLAREITGSRKAAFVAGLIFAFYPYRLIHRNQLKLLSVQWIPLFALYLMRLTREGRLRDGLKTGIALALCGLCGAQLMILSTMWAGIWLLYSLIAEREDPMGKKGSEATWSRQTVLALLLSGLVCSVLVVPFFAPLVMALLEPNAAQGLAASQVGKVTDLLAYFVPSRYHPLIHNGALEEAYERWVHIRRVAAVGYTALGLAVWAAVKRWQRARFWILAALLLAVLALGSTLRVNGRELSFLPAPYQLLAPTLLGKALRHPSRLNLILALPVAVLAAIGLADLLERLRLRRQWITGPAVICAAALILFEYLPLPFYTTGPIRSAFYDQLQEETGEFAVADFPIGFHAHDKWYMYAQTLHERPMIGGHVSRVPVHAHDFIDGVPLLEAARVSPPKEGALGDISRQLGLLAEENVRYVLIHKYRAGPNQVRRWRKWFAVQPCYEDRQLLVFRTTPRFGRDFQFLSEIEDGIGVISTTLSTHVLAQEGLLGAEVVWGTREAPSQNWTAYLALIGPAGEEAQRALFEPYPGWPTLEWERDAVVRGQGTLQVDPFVERGTYTVTIGLLDLVTGAKAGEPIAIGQVEVQAVERTFEMPEMGVESDVVFGEVLRLLGYDRHRTADQLTLTLHWQALRRMDISYKFFVHLVDVETGELVAQSDVIPYNWTYPTTWWKANEIVSDEITLSLADVLPGSYRLEIGVYHPDSGDRLPLAGDREPQQPFDKKYSEATPSDRLILSEQVKVRE